MIRRLSRLAVVAAAVCAAPAIMRVLAKAEFYNFMSSMP